MNRKLFGLFTVLFLLSAGLYAQSDDDLFSGSDEDFFASIDDSVFAENDDDLFGGSEDDLFDSNGIEVVEEVKAKTDLSKGVLFENGSIKIGGNLSTSLSTMTTLYSEDEENFGENLKNTNNSNLKFFLNCRCKAYSIFKNVYQVWNIVSNIIFCSWI